MVGALLVGDTAACNVQLLHSVAGKLGPQCGLQGAAAVAAAEAGGD